MVLQSSVSRHARRGPRGSEYGAQQFHHDLTIATAGGVQQMSRFGFQWSLVPASHHSGLLRCLDLECAVLDGMSEHSSRGDHILSVHLDLWQRPSLQCTVMVRRSAEQPQPAVPGTTCEQGSLR
nr:hypothetical protein CFP56_00534 [Quercus suber]